MKATAAKSRTLNFRFCLENDNWIQSARMNTRRCTGALVPCSDGRFRGYRHKRSEQLRRCDSRTRLEVESSRYRGTRDAMGAKRCSHGKEKRSCAECTPCPHGKVKYYCVECNPCPHGKVKYVCAKCTPCPHGKRKNSCAECNPCPHGNRKSNCAACKHS